MPESFLREVAVFTCVLVFAGFISEGIKRVAGYLIQRWNNAGFELTPNGKVVFKHESIETNSAHLGHDQSQS